MQNFLVPLTSYLYDTIKQVNIHGDVIYVSKNSSGQKIHLSFAKYVNGLDVVWYPFLWFGKRKLGYQYLKQTGKDGLKSLFWAKQQMKTFIDELNPRYNHTIVVQWDDNRRRDVYIRGLKELGFYMSIMNKKKSLLLKVNKK